MSIPLEQSHQFDMLALFNSAASASEMLPDWVSYMITIIIRLNTPTAAPRPLIGESDCSAIFTIEVFNLQQWMPEQDHGK
jgi:hypothetical protein